MKRITYLMILIMATSLAAQAQLFFGGSLNFSTSGGSNEYNGTTNDNPSAVNFNISPKGGYMITDDFWVGGILSLGISHTNSKADPEVITNASSFGFIPFARYYAFRFNKFSFFAEAQAGMSFGSTKTKVDNTTTDGPKETSIGLNVFPGMAFDISDKIQLEASINAFSLGINHYVEKQDDYTERSTTTGFNVNLNNIVTSGSITVGAIVKL